MKPSAICIYPNADAATIPGTDTKVTPDIAEPIIAKATMYQGWLRLPLKKVELSLFLPDIQEIMKTNANQESMVAIIAESFISCVLRRQS